MRLKTALYLLENEPWDFFMCHIMETDRFGHFFWEDFINGDSKYAARGLDFFEKVSDFIGEITRRIGDETELIVLSDHGFCTLKKEVYINNALAEGGFLKLAAAEPKGPKDISPDSLAYSMIPGRFFVNLKGREKTGSVSKDKDYEKVIADLADCLMNVTDPEDGSPVIKRLYRKEEIYSGPLLEQAADLIAVPHDGYDLKGNLKAPSLFIKDALQGMHTDWDAALFVRGRKIDADRPHILDAAPSIITLFGAPAADPDFDGKNIFAQRL
jgi:predicted AlkP superfamily phosphohydrolase/phosphomutase